MNKLSPLKKDYNDPNIKALKGLFFPLHQGSTLSKSKCTYDELGLRLVRVSPWVEDGSAVGAARFSRAHGMVQFEASFLLKLMGLLGCRTPLTPAGLQTPRIKTRRDCSLCGPGPALDPEPGYMVSHTLHAKIETCMHIESTIIVDRRGIWPKPF